MTFKALMFSLACLAVALAECIDTKTNVINVEDGRPALPIHTVGGSFGAYSVKQEPSCHEQKVTVPSFKFPGSIKLLSGSITVSKPLKLVGQTKLLLTVQKRSALVGIICQDGVSRYAGLDNKYCQPDVCKEPTKFCKLLENPGTYDFDTLREAIGKNGSLPLPPAPLLLKRVLTGEWRLDGKFVVGDEVVGHLKVATTAGWIYFEEGKI
ncbi:unnamed protein product [Bursaphelenchus xylophilus]|uniref:(pine wood nematode) hypothetical protein n=1 Tax=Bursaphelenchus xylophilus TaxID=6326 RepID=A0A1I7RYS1_BURXY|nr:unnamed protein product [Bursaphelenchus xylophilus]CAG9092319.1 unnamed protein product [Bursaphelenchus xylophilus]